VEKRNEPARKPAMIQSFSVLSECDFVLLFNALISCYLSHYIFAPVQSMLYSVYIHLSIFVFPERISNGLDKSHPHFDIEAKSYQL